MTSPPSQPQPPDSGDHIPLEPIPDRPAPPAKAKPSLLDGDLTNCPGCGHPLEKGGVVCTKCGLDLRVGQRREIEVGEVEVPDPAGKPEFLTKTRLPTNIHAIAGACCAIAAAILAGINAPRGNNALVIAMVLKTLYDTLVHTGTGVVAIAIGALLAGAKLTRFDWAAARMFLAFAIFQLVSQIRIPGAAVWVSGLLFALAAAVMYFLALMALLKKPKDKVFTIAVLHAALWMLFQLGFWLASWLGRELEHLPRTG